MTATARFSDAESARLARFVCTAAMISLAIAMGVGRFAFTPLFPLMVRDGLLDHEVGATLAASNYLGYLLGAWSAGRLRLKPGALLCAGLVSTVVVTGAVGWTSSVPSWLVLRFFAGVLSAWTLIATSAWGLGWLASLERTRLSGIIFSGVGIGIAAVGVFCMLEARSAIPASRMWIELALLSGMSILFPLIVSRRSPSPLHHAAAPSRNSKRDAPINAGGLIACYSLFGFGYILPATYLPALARQLVDDPQVFGWAWPVFGFAAAVSTVAISWRAAHANRLRVWAISHWLMAAGVLLPIVWASIASIVIAALLVGGTFMVITMVAMQEVQARTAGNATVMLARMTAGFAIGQLLGPIVSAALGRLLADYSAALHTSLGLAAAGLIGSAIYLWREESRQPLTTAPRDG